MVSKRMTGASRRRVLVAEDCYRIRDLVVKLLREQGYAVDAVADGEAALDAIDAAPKVDARPFDAMLLDVNMPRVSGIDVLERMHTHGRAAHVVLMTGLATPEVHARARSLGAARVLEKPFKVRDLMDAIDPAPAPDAAPKRPSDWVR